MSQQLNLTIGFALKDEPESQSPLLIEQEDWDTYTGMVTKANLARQLSDLLYSETFKVKVDCGVTDDEVVSVIYVYRLIPGVQYQLLTTHGTLTGPKTLDVEIDETLHFGVDIKTPLKPSEATLRYSVTYINSQVWASSYDATGTKIPSPAVTLSGRKVIASTPVFGSLRVKYTTTRDEYILTVPKRTSAEENFYSAYLVGLPAGYPPSFLQFEPPPTAEEMAEEGTECGRGKGGDSGDASRPEHPLDAVTASKHQRTIIVDYCTQEVIVDSTI